MERHFDCTWRRIEVRGEEKLFLTEMYIVNLDSRRIDRNAGAEIRLWQVREITESVWCATSAYPHMFGNRISSLLYHVKSKRRGAKITPKMTKNG